MAGELCYSMILIWAAYLAIASEIKAHQNQLHFTNNTFQIESIKEQSIKAHRRFIN